MGLIRFTMVKPGGNNTALVHDLIPRQYHGEIAKEVILKQDEKGEQVGYLELSTLPKTVCRLQMMGGEFCGNATRSTVMLITKAFLTGDVGLNPFALEHITRSWNRLDVPMEVSGFDGVLHAEVVLDDQNHILDIFATMPVRPEATCTEKRQPTVNGKPFDATLVHLYGISHLLIPESDGIAGLNRDARMQHAERILTEEKLRDLEAAGVIFYTEHDGQYAIDPYVFVRDSNTMYAETACGTGTTALGVKCALDAGGPVNLSVMQPSGLPISISVAYDGKEFAGARISGPIEVLYDDGTAEVGDRLLDDTVCLHRITSAEAFEPYAQAVGTLYARVFYDPPYNERFKSEDGAADLRKIAADPQGLLFLALDGDTVVGFSGAVPVDRYEDIVPYVSAYIPVASSYYMAELGVAPAYRGRNLSHKLIDARLEALPDSFDTVVVRTSVDNTATQHLYRESRGYHELDGVRQETISKKLKPETGEIVDMPDPRLFLVKKIK
ncbi:MAG: GNAT family N-acetyltransferase [bacterium]|nr:GNAT family N-acetyltransferase [bacterium]